MENDEQHYESEATEDWVCSGMISFKMSFVGRERKSLKVYMIVISISFSYSKCVLEGDRAEADENHSYVWMRQTMRGRRVWEPSSCWGAGPPPTECGFDGPRREISAMGPEFLATALRAIPVSGPSVYHLVFTPYSSFLTVTRLKSVSPHGGGRFSIGSSQTITLLQTTDDASNDQCQAWICHTRRMFPRSLANEIYYPLWCGWKPVANSTREGWYKHRSAVRKTLVDILL